MLPSLSLASASAFVVSPTRMPAHAAPRLGAVRCEPYSFNFGMPTDVVKIPFIQRLLSDFVGFDGGAQFEVDDDYAIQANHSATLLLKPDRTPAETASLVPFVTAQFLSIHSIDTRTSNVEVHHRAFMRRPCNLPSLPVCLSTLPSPPPTLPTLWQVKDSAQGWSLKSGAVFLGLVVAAQHECKVTYGAILFQWWRVAIVVLLVQRAVFVVAKLLLTTNGREMYKKKRES